MIEVLWHGRGGQGAFTAARLLGAAASLSEGRFALAFPSFGPERRGAPMRAFTKMSDTLIGDRSAIGCADYVIYLDGTLLGTDWEAELKPGGRVLVNSADSSDDPRIVAIDADGVSSAILGRPIPNTVFLGALCVLCDQVSVDDVKEAIRQYMPAKLHAANVEIVDAAIRELTSSTPSAADVPISATPTASVSSAASPAQDVSPEEPVAEESSEALPALTANPRPKAHISSLRTGDLDPASFARTTCFEAGYLVSKNAGWRNVRPVIDGAACTGCLQCYLLCPDGTVYKTSGAAAVAIDYDFCKGCGICAKACKFDAIAMVSESEANAR